MTLACQEGMDWKDSQGRTVWKDGAGRYTLKFDTGEATRGGVILNQRGHLIGICRAPGWMVIYGPFFARLSEDAKTHQRAHEQALEAMAARARERRFKRVER